MMRRMMTMLLALVMVLSLVACGGGSDAGADAPENSDAPYTGVEDGVFTVGMECAYAPYNWTQMDDSNGAVPIANNPGSYANGYDVMIASFFSISTASSFSQPKNSTSTSTSLPPRTSFSVRV